MCIIKPIGDFDSWLREQAKCANCETYYKGSTCGNPKSDELVAAMAEASGAPVQTFTVDPNASARWCPLWEAESDWRGRMRRSWDMSVEEERSAAAHHRAVSAHKGYGRDAA
jgi:hypothetical protein